MCLEIKTEQKIESISIEPVPVVIEEVKNEPAPVKTEEVKNEPVLDESIIHNADDMNNYLESNVNGGLINPQPTKRFVTNDQKPTGFDPKITI